MKNISVLFFLVVTIGFSWGLRAQSDDSLARLNLIEEKYRSYEEQVESISEEKKLILEWDPQSEDAVKLDRQQEEARQDLIRFLKAQLDWNPGSEQVPDIRLFNRAAEIYQEIGEAKKARDLYKKLFIDRPVLLDTNMGLSKIGKAVQRHLKLEGELDELGDEFRDKLKSSAFKNKTDEEILRKLDEWCGLYLGFKKVAAEDEKLLIELTENTSVLFQKLDAMETVFSDFLNEVNNQAKLRNVDSAITIKKKIITIHDNCGWHEKAYPMMLEVAELKSDKGKAIEYCKEIVDYCEKHKLYAEAVEVCKGAVKRYPAHPEAAKFQFKVIELYGDVLKQYDKALEECRVLRENFKTFQDDARLHFRIGHLYYLSRKPDKAVPEFELFLKKQPRSIKAKLFIASCYIQLRDYEQARAVCKTILAESPEQNLIPKINDIIAYTYLLEQQYPEAAAISKKGRDILKKFPHLKRRDFSDTFGVGDDRPNIVFISIDTLRADHVHCLGYGRDTTPTIDSLAKGGCLFSKLQAVSSWTVPTHASMFTGVYPSVHRCVNFTSPIAEEIPTLAEILSQAGYTTASFSSNPTLNTNLGFGRGFGLFDDFSVDMWLEIESTIEDRTKKRVINTETSSSLTRAILDWLDKNHSKKFFLFALYMDPHYNYTPVPPYDTRYDSGYKGTITGNVGYVDKPSPRDIEHVKALYDGEIRYTDEYVGKVVEYLKKLGHADDTVIVILSDHGEEFWEHGGVQHERTLYQEVLWVPMVIWYPKLIPAGVRVDELVSHVDVMPSILDLAGIKPPAAINGRNLAYLINKNGSEVFRDAAFSELDIAQRVHERSIYQGNKKVTYGVDLKQSWLYDLKDDPYEMNGEEMDLIFGVPEFEKALNEWRKTCKSITKELGVSSKKITIDPTTLKRLRELGYVQ